MTLERMVDLTLSNSYRMPNLDLSIERTRHILDAERARLRSRVSLDLSVPELEYRMNELDLDETRGRNVFRVDLELSYGREKQDPRFGDLWEAPTNTYTIDENATSPSGTGASGARGSRLR